MGFSGFRNPLPGICPVSWPVEQFQAEKLLRKQFNEFQVESCFFACSAVFEDDPAVRSRLETLRRDSNGFVMLGYLYKPYTNPKPWPSLFVSDSLNPKP